MPIIHGGEVSSEKQKMATYELELTSRQARMDLESRCSKVLRISSGGIRVNDGRHMMKLTNKPVDIG